ncbi:MAG: FtsB family cell division protein [Lachnospirales bacterium]
MKRSKIFVLVFTAISIFGCIYVFRSVNEYNKLVKVNEELVNELEKSDKKIVDIKNDIVYQDSIEFVKKVARDQLGYVNGDEFIFKVK